MALKGTAAKCEAAAKAEALEEKKAEKAAAKAAAAKAAAEDAALKKAAANPARPGRKSWYAQDGSCFSMETAATQVDHVFGDTQDDTPLTTLAEAASGDDEPLQTPAMNADDTAGEDGQQQPPEQQSPEQQSPAQEACRPLSPPHHTNLQI